LQKDYTLEPFPAERLLFCPLEFMRHRTWYRQWNAKRIDIFLTRNWLSQSFHSVFPLKIPNISYFQSV
jgi:hypothetical protein